MVKARHSLRAIVAVGAGFCFGLLSMPASSPLSRIVGGGGNFAI